MSRKGRFKVTSAGVAWHTVMAEHSVIEQLKPYSIAANLSLRDYLTRLIKNHLDEMAEQINGGETSNAKRELGNLCGMAAGKV